MIRTYGRTAAIALVLVAGLLAMAPMGAEGAEAPVKEVPSIQVGHEVNMGNGGGTCLIESEKCQLGRPSAQQGGFEYANGIAVGTNGDVYVLDTNNSRIQELTPTGAFVSMFGREVNKTTKGDTCTQTEVEKGVECKKGVAGPASGQLGYPLSIAVDPASGNIFIAEIVFGKSGDQTTFGERVQELTPSWQFVLEIGKEVNETTKGNLCTQADAEKGIKCTGPAQKALGASGENTEPGAFAFGQTAGVLAVGGPQDLLYVGEEHAIQTFDASTAAPVEDPISKRLLELSAKPDSMVTAMAVDQAGDVYVIYSVDFTANTIREFNPAGQEINHFEVPPLEAGATIGVQRIALDPGGLLAATEIERGYRGTTPYSRPFGVVYDASTFHQITKFGGAPSSNGTNAFADMTFDEGHTLYVTSMHEVIVFNHLPVAELTTGSAPCKVGAEHETDVTLNCTLEGQVNPWGVPNTEARFQWGETSALGFESPIEMVCTASCGSTPIDIETKVEGVRPNQDLTYRLVGRDQNVPIAEEPLTSEEKTITTDPVAPQIVGVPTVIFAGSTSAVMRGEVNPENTETLYMFEYGVCPEGLDTCQEVGRTEPQVSNAYGPLSTTLEATGLQPVTTYAYRLVAVNVVGEEAALDAGQEGTFTTAATSVPRVTTGEASAIGPNSARISGTVEPEGQPATYGFELGLFRGSQTQYSVVSSASIGGNVAVPVSLVLNGLQPGTAYAYRVRVSSGYGSETGGVATFTTTGLPSVLVSPAPLAMLDVPSIRFPKPERPNTRKRTLANALKVCRKMPRKRRARCERKTRAAFRVARARKSR